MPKTCHTTSLPPWLQTGNHQQPSRPGHAGVRQTFLERTARSCARFLEKTLLSERFAARPGFWQRLEPRCKLVALLSLLLALSLLRSPALAWGLYLLVTLLACCSRIDLFFFSGRVWLFVPLFALVIIAPAVCNVVTPGEPLWVAFRLERGYSLGPYRIPAELAVTRQGVAVALLFMGRVAGSVSLALLLTLTTPWHRLMAALRGLGVPAIFVLTAAMAFRYVFLLVGMVNDMHAARCSRTVRFLPTRAEQQWVAGRIGYLFRRSFTLGNEVHGAMLSRGFAGEVRVLEMPTPERRDYLTVAVALLLGVTLVVADHLALR